MITLPARICLECGPPTDTFRHDILPLAVLIVDVDVPIVLERS